MEKMGIARKISVGLVWLAVIMAGTTLIFIFLGKQPRKIKKESQPATTAFNYPAPPVDGEKNYFPIAENGQARCVVVSGSNTIPRPAEGLRTYLQLAAGAQSPNAKRWIDDVSISEYVEQESNIHLFLPKTSAF